MQVEDIRTVMIDGERWFVGKDVTRILGYSNSSKALKDHVDKEDKLNNESLSNLGQRGGWLVNESGLYQLVSSSRMPNAIEIAKSLDIDICSILNCTKEQETINDIMHTFKGEKMVRQYPCGTYYIDLYFPKYKLAIECDELGHRDRDQEYEKTRQHYIEDKLGCKFIRYNPDSKDYNIFNVLNKIHKEISKKYLLDREHIVR